jgi:hypothetical protein
MTTTGAAPRIVWGAGELKERTLDVTHRRSYRTNDVGERAYPYGEGYRCTHPGCASIKIVDTRNIRQSCSESSTGQLVAPNPVREPEGPTFPEPEQPDLPWSSKRKYGGGPKFPFIEDLRG